MVGAVIASYWDWSERRVPNSLNLGWCLCGMALALGLDGLPGGVQSLLGILVGGLAMLVPFLLRVYLGGDVKLVMAMGAWLGPLKILNTFALGVVLGGVFALGFMAKRKWGSGTPSVHGEHEPLGDADRVPMAIPFAVSGVLAFFGLGY